MTSVFILEIFKADYLSACMFLETDSSSQNAKIKIVVHRFTYSMRVTTR